MRALLDTAGGQLEPHMVVAACCLPTEEQLVLHEVPVRQKPRPGLTRDRDIVDHLIAVRKSWFDLPHRLFGARVVVALVDNKVPLVVETPRKIIDRDRFGRSVVVERPQGMSIRELRRSAFGLGRVSVSGDAVVPVDRPLLFILKGQSHLSALHGVDLLQSSSLWPRGRVVSPGMMTPDLRDSTRTGTGLCQSVDLTNHTSSCTFPCLFRREVKAKVAHVDRVSDNDPTHGATRVRKTDRRCGGFEEAFHGSLDSIIGGRHWW